MPVYCLVAWLGFYLQTIYRSTRKACLECNIPRVIDRPGKTEPSSKRIRLSYQNSSPRPSCLLGSFLTTQLKTSSFEEFGSWVRLETYHFALSTPPKSS